MRKASIAIGALLMASCSGGGGDPAVSIEDLRSRTTEFQRDILADGLVTPDEYEKVVLATRDCVIDAGFSPSEPEWTRGELIYFTELTAADETSLAELNERLDEAQDACDAEFSREVSAAWVAQNSLSPEERDAIRSDVIACLSRVGVEVSNDASEDEVYAALRPDNSSAWSVCVEEYPGFFVTAPTQG